MTGLLRSHGMAQKESLIPGRRWRADADAELVAFSESFLLGLVAGVEAAELEARQFALHALREGVPADRLADAMGRSRSSFYRWVRGESARRIT